MKTLKKFALDLMVPVVSLAVPLLAAAQVPQPPITAPNAGINSIGAVSSSLCAITNWLFYFLILLAVIFIIIAAYKYLTAAGDPEKVKAASHSLLYAAIAIVVAILAKAVPSLVGSIIGQNGVTTGC
jgi:Type IV secretion system pilin